LSVKYALLGILSEGERHGYDLKEAFDERIGEFWGLNFGQIYSTLDRLEREGLVEWREEPQERRPDRKIFRITAKGRRELEEWLLRPVGRPRALRDELFIKLVFLQSSDHGPILDLIDQQKKVYMSHMQRLTRRKVELSARADRRAFFVTDVLIDAALFHAEADLKWLSHTEQKIRSGGPTRRAPRRKEET
jgi:DNA-binding PadR family transcriptional regulator